MKDAIACAWTFLSRLRAFVVPAVLLVATEGRANTNPVSHNAAPIVREVDGTLFVFERGTSFPVPDEAAAALREFLSTTGVDGVVSLEVGRTIVADGGSGYHGSGQKP